MQKVEGKLHLNMWLFELIAVFYSDCESSALKAEPWFFLFKQLYSWINDPVKTGVDLESGMHSRCIDTKLLDLIIIIAERPSLALPPSLFQYSYFVFQHENFSNYFHFENICGCAPIGNWRHCAFRIAYYNDEIVMKSFISHRHNSEIDCAINAKRHA